MSIQGSDARTAGVASRYERRIGERVGSLVFHGVVTKTDANLRVYGKFFCDCGAAVELGASRVLNQKRPTHCGCQTDKGANRKHGMRNSREYSSWSAMVGRCHNENHKDFPRWGAVGITVCERWRKFDNFYHDMGQRPPDTSIDRINGDEGYHPGNCRWATPKTQARNTKSFVIVNTPEGVMPLVDYAKKIGLSRGAAHLRLKRGKLEGVSYE